MCGCVAQSEESPSSIWKVHGSRPGLSAVISVMFWAYITLGSAGHQVGSKVVVLIKVDGSNKEREECGLNELLCSSVS